MCADDFLDSTNLLSRKASADLQSHGIEPEFRNLIAALNVNVGRFVAIACIEEETVWADSQCCWRLFQFSAAISRVTTVYLASP